MSLIEVTDHLEIDRYERLGSCPLLDDGYVAGLVQTQSVHLRGFWQFPLVIEVFSVLLVLPNSYCRIPPCPSLISLENIKFNGQGQYEFFPILLTILLCGAKNEKERECLS